MLEPSRGIVAQVALRTWVKTLRHPVTLVFSFFQPLMWMLFFGFLFHRYAVELPAGMAYLDFLAPGVCAMTVLLGASQSGVGFVRDMQTGFLARMLETPAAPGLMLAGRLGAETVRLLAQAVVVCLLGLALGARMRWSAGPALTALAALALFAWGYAGLSSWIALRTKSQETMAVFVHAVNLPVLFTSAALVPVKHMPPWLAAVAAWNPLTLVAEALRGALLAGSSPAGFGTLLPLALLAVATSALAVRAMAGARE